MGIDIKKCEPCEFAAAVAFLATGNVEASIEAMVLAIKDMAKNMKKIKELPGSLRRDLRLIEIAGLLGAPFVLMQFEHGQGLTFEPILLSVRRMRAALARSELAARVAMPLDRELKTMEYELSTRPKPKVNRPAEGKIGTLGEVAHATPSKPQAEAETQEPEVEAAQAPIPEDAARAEAKRARNKAKEAAKRKTRETSSTEDEIAAILAEVKADGDDGDGQKASPNKELDNAGFNA